MLRLIGVQYKDSLRVGLIESLNKTLFNGNAKARCRFITLSELAINMLDQTTFMEHFLKSLKKGFVQEKTSSVIKEYLQSFVRIWEKVNENGNDEMIAQIQSILTRSRSFPEELNKLVVDIRTQIRKDVEIKPKDPSLVEKRRQNAISLKEQHQL